MSAKEELQRKIESLQAKIDAAQKSLDQILIDEWEWKVGDVVMHYGNRLQITRIGIKYGEPRGYGKKFLKSGKLGNQEVELYGTITRG